MSFGCRRQRRRGQHWAGWSIKLLPPCFVLTRCHFFDDDFNPDGQIAAVEEAQ